MATKSATRAKRAAAPAAPAASTPPAATSAPVTAWQAPAYTGAAPKGASLSDKLVLGRKYSPRPGTKYSTLNQWADLNAAIDAGQTVGEILAEYALVNPAQGQVDRGYLTYVLARGWVTTA